MSSMEKDLLRELLKIPSVNPRLAPESTNSCRLLELTDFLVSYCESQGWPWMRQPVHPGEDNLVALVPGSEKSSVQGSLLWEVHQDTVAVEGMSIDPFAGEASNGRIWGRGACDVKGGMAAMLAAASILTKQAERARPTVLLAFSVNEEAGFTGAKALAKLLDSKVSSDHLSASSGPLSIEQVRDHQPYGAIVAEPTSLNVVRAHQGVVRWKCHARGLAAHTSRPDEGENAIYAMSEFTLAVEQLHREKLSLREPHSLCGTPSVSVSTILGGTGVNTVPDHVVVDVDRRLAPGERPEAAREQLIQWTTERMSSRNVEIRHDQPWLESVGLDSAKNGAWAGHVAEVVRSTGIDCKIVGAPYGTDAPAIAAAGIPTVVFGPGSIEQAHTEDEWIDQNELSQAVEVLINLASG